MDYTHLISLFLAVGVIAFLYSSVGHAGASGYIAIMTLWELAPTVIRPTALVLNILVASIGAFQFWRAGHFSWKLFWPFALLSIPAGYFTAVHSIPALGILLGAAAVIGGISGSYLGSRHFPVRTISILLAIVLSIAGTKLIFTR